MTIIFLTRRFYPLIGGVEKHVLEISKELIKKGHKIVVITENPHNYSSKRNLKASEAINGIDIYRINIGKNDWFKKFRIWIELWKLKNLFDKADIVHCHDVFFWYLPFRFIKLTKPVYTTFHGYESYPITKTAIIVRKISEKLSRGNICIGEYIRKWYGTRPDYVTYGGVSRIGGSLQKNEKKLNIVLIGRLEYDIGVNVYANALKKLKDAGINFTFRAYGEGGLSKKLEKYGKINGFTDNLQNIIKTADIVFASSYLIMLECLVSKKIVIAVYENQLKEDYLRTSPFGSFIYICKDAEAVSDVTVSLNKDSWKSNTMIEQGHNWAREQTWEKVAYTYLKLWNL